MLLPVVGLSGYGRVKRKVVSLPLVGSPLDAPVTRYFVDKIPDHVYG
jgi:hypothetical protein